jgi:hypothetical protein
MGMGSIVSQSLRAMRRIEGRGYSMRYRKSFDNLLPVYTFWNRGVCGCFGDFMACMIYLELGLAEDFSNHYLYL